MLSSLLQLEVRRNGREPAVDFSGVWFNELGAKLTLAVDSAGRVSGRFRTAVGSPMAAADFTLTGFASGDLISFCVDFGKYGSLTSWVGHHSDNPPGAIIRTMWLLGRNIEDPDTPGPALGAVLTGCSNFSR